MSDFKSADKFLAASSPSSSSESSTTGSPPMSKSGIIAAQTTRRPKRQPLLALGKRRAGVDLCHKHVNQNHLLVASLSDSEKKAFYDKLHHDLDYFLRTVTDDWNEEEKCRRFSVLGDCITCVRWEEKFIISGSDVVKAVTAIVKLRDMGRTPKNIGKYEDSILADLRSIKQGQGVFVEQAHSPLIQFLYSLNAVRTHKRQKVFLWHAIPFNNLADEVCRRQQATENNLPLIRKRRVKLDQDTHLLAARSAAIVPEASKGLEILSQTASMEMAISKSDQLVPSQAAHAFPSLNGSWSQQNNVSMIAVKSAYARQSPTGSDSTQQSWSVSPSDKHIHHTSSALMDALYMHRYRPSSAAATTAVQQFGDGKSTSHDGIHQPNPQVQSRRSSHHDVIEDGMLSMVADAALAVSKTLEKKSRTSPSLRNLYHC